MRQMVCCRLAAVVAVFTMAACLGHAANAANLGEVPGNAGLQSTCSKIQFLGPMITAWCTDRTDLTFKSEVDVRTCVGYLVVDDGTGHIRCRQPIQR
jgi:hypothetical protein